MKQALLIGAGLMVLAACGGGSTTSPTGGSGTSSAAGSGTSFNTGSTSLGTVLTDPASGKTLYYFLPEKGSVVVCAKTAACNSTWPPLTGSGTPTAPSVATGQLSLVSLPDGSSEIAYSGWPLHTYSGDGGPGDTNGQGIDNQWFAATPGLTSSGSGAGGPTSSASSPSSSSSASANPYGGAY